MPTIHLARLFENSAIDYLLVVVSSLLAGSVPGGRGGFLQLPLRIRGGADPADGAGAQARLERC